MPRRRTILAVDDDECTRKILKGLLTRGGFDVRLASDGREALELVHAGPPPDVILLDLQMPVMTGVEVLSAMRANPAWAAIPTVILTASEECTAAQFGVAGLLLKPFHDADLQAVIRSALARHDGRGEAQPAGEGA